VTRVYAAQDAGATLYAGGLNIGGTAVTSTAAELNVLDGALKENNSIYIGSDPSATTDNANYNVSVGISALNAITTGDNNVAVGFQGLLVNTSGYQNTAVGNDAMRFNTSGYRNTGIGQGSLYKNTTGVYNTSSGAYSLYSNTTSNYSSAFGYKALYLSTGSGNTGFGYSAGDIITTGANNVILGTSADPSAADGENQIVIGYGATGTGNNEIALGNTSISAIKAQVTSITGYSDSRIKRDIRNNHLGLAFINKLRTVKYKLKNPADYPLALREKRFMEGNEKRPQDDEKIYDGLIAQEVKAVIDELGIEWSGWSKNDSDGKQGIQYGALTVPLIKAVQEQQAQIEILQRQYAQVTSQNQELMKLVSTQLLKKNDAEVKLIRSDESNNDDKSETVITSMK
jgi:hypothetical protein